VFVKSRDYCAPLSDDILCTFRVKVVQAHMLFLNDYGAPLSDFIMHMKIQIL